VISAYFQDWAQQNHEKINPLDVSCFLAERGISTAEQGCKLSGTGEFAAKTGDIFGTC